MESPNKLPAAQELKKMMDALRMGWWTADLQAETFICSDRIAAFLDKGSNRLPFAEFIRMVRRDYRPRVTEQFAAIALGKDYEQTFPLEYRGETLWIHSRTVERQTGPGGEVLVNGVAQVVNPVLEEMPWPPKGSVGEPNGQDKLYTSLLGFLESDDVTPVIRASLKDVLEQFKGSYIALMEYDYEQGVQSCACEVVDDANRIFPTTPVWPFERVSWWTKRMQAGLPVIESDITRLPEEAAAERKIMAGQGVRSLIAVPLMGPDKVWGYIMMNSREPREWSPGDYQRFASLASLISICMQFHAAQKIIQQSEEKLNNIYRSMPVGIELYDKTGILVDMNDKELEIFGLKQKEDALGVNVFDNPNIPDEVKAALKRKERVEFTITYDFDAVGDYYSTTRQKTIFLVTIAMPLFDAKGELTHYMFIYIDNTETTTAHRRIEAFEEMTSLIGEFAQVGYANFDAYTRLGSALDSWYVNLGEEPGIPMDQVVGVLNHVNPEDKAAVKEFFAKVKKGEAKHLRHDVRVTTDDGQERWTRLNVMVRDFYPEEQRIGMVCVNYDITALKQTERNLIVARDKAQTSDKLKSAFLANMSHEIRTPLNAIVGFSNLLAETDSKEERRQYMSVVQENNELLLNLISDILDISKIEAGTMEFTSAKVDVHQLCREVIQSFSIKATEAIELRFDEDTPRVILEGDKNRIMQVLSNFMTNAMKFTPEGSITLSYEKVGEREIRFKVSDTGIGIAQEKQDEIFSRFVKLDSFAQGTGLGLSICQSLVERMGGKIGVTSQRGKGSCFWFTHPFDPALSPEAENGCAAGQSQAASYSGTGQEGAEKPLVLIAEDIDSNYLLISTLLAKEYRLVRAVNGIEAVDLFGLERPAIVLMDMKMPEMDGLEATSIIRQADPLIPIVAVTAFAFDSDRAAAMEVGCNDFLTKPIAPAALREVIRKWIG